MKKIILRVAFLVMFPLVISAQCGVIFQGNYISSENCSITGGQFLYNIIVSVTSSSTLNIYGLWGESTNIAANLVCGTDSFTIPLQSTQGIFYRGGGRLNGILVRIHYFAHYTNDPEDECNLYYQPVVALDPNQNLSTKVYPNPFVDRLLIENEGFDGEERLLELFEVNGKTRVATSITTPTYTLETSNLQSGIYFYALKNDGKTLQHGMVMKQ